METSQSQRRAPMSPVVLTISAWSIVALLFIGQNVIRELTLGRPVDFRRDVYEETVYWIAFASLTPVLVWLCKRFSLIAGNRRRAFAVHFFAAPGMAALQASIYFAMLIASALALGSLAVRGIPAWLASRASVFILLTLTAYWKYWVIVGLIHGFAYARLYAREQQAAAELRAQLEHAQLDRLKAQLQPHFLFNTLNSIAVLLRDQPERARTMLLRLSDMLRAVVDAGDEQLVPFARELTFIQQYLDIQQMRFGERLHVDLDIGAQVERELVPHFLIQPLVENAVQHGISTTESGGTVFVRAQRRDGELHIEVQDTPLVPAERVVKSVGSGVGLSNTRERLARLYGGAASLTITPSDGGGTRVEVRIPARSDG